MMKQVDKYVSAQQKILVQDRLPIKESKLSLPHHFLMK